MAMKGLKRTLISGRAGSMMRRSSSLPGGGDQGQQLVVEELALALAVDDDERDLVTIALRPGLADQVLLDDVQQQGGLAGARSCRSRWPA